MRRLGPGCLVGLVLLVPDAMAAEWSRDLYAGDYATATHVAATSDGGALVAGGSVLGAMLARMDPQGTIRWSIGHGTGMTDPHGFVMLPGEQSLVMGATTVALGNDQGWVARFDANGTVLWDRTILGRSQDGELDDADTLVSGEIIVAGWAGTPLVSSRPVVMGLDPAGGLNWQLGLDFVTAYGVGIVATVDGGFLLVGRIQDVRVGEGFVAKFDASRRVEWQHGIGGVESDYFTDAVQVADGGFVLLGWTRSAAGPWLVKLTASGAVEWSVVPFVGTGVIMEAIQTSPDGGLLVSGTGNASRGGRIGKIDASGNLEWAVEHGTADSRSRGMALASDGGTYFVGFDRDPVTLEWVPWLLKLDSQGLGPSACRSSVVPPLTSRPVVDVIDTTYAVIDPGLTIEPTLGATTTRDILVARLRCPPGEVAGVRVQCSGSGATLTWDPVFEADEYEVYRGTLPAVMPLAYDHADIGACALASTTWTDPLACDDGNDSYYVVIARNAAGRGPYGTNSLGATVPPAAAECP